MQNLRDFAHFADHCQDEIANRVKLIPVAILGELRDFVPQNFEIHNVRLEMFEATWDLASPA